MSTRPRRVAIPRGERRRSSLNPVHASNSGPSAFAARPAATADDSSDSGDIFTIAGNGTRGLSGDGGLGTLAAVSTPTDVKYGDGGDLYVIQGYNDYSDRAIRYVDGSDTISTVPGSLGMIDADEYLAPILGTDGQGFFYEDGYILGYMNGDSGTNQVLASYFEGQLAGGVLRDGNGDVYAAGGYGISEYEGNGEMRNVLDGSVCGMAFDKYGDIIFTTDVTESDSPACTTIDEITATGGVKGITSFGTSDLAGVTVDADGNIFVSETDGQIDEWTTTGHAYRIAGDGTDGFGGDGGPATDAQLNNPLGLTLDDDGDLYIADSGNNRVREIADESSSGAAPTPSSGPQAPPPPPPPVVYTSPTGGPGGNEGTGGGNGGEGCGCNQAQSGGYPINTASGEFWHTFTDMTIPGRGPAFDLTRTYSSNLASTESAFGYGWTSPYTMDLTADSDGNVEVHQENGAIVLFNLNSDGTYSPAQPRMLATLTTTSSGDFVFTRKAQQTFTFNPDGQLLSIADLNGNTTRLGYDSNGNLSTLTDPAGRVVDVVTSNGLITSVTGPTGRSVNYGYDSEGDLTSVTDPTGAVWTFGYDENHLLTAMLDPNQQGAASPQALTNTYNSGDQVTSQTDFADRTTTYAYDGDSFSSTGGTTTVTDPRGDVTAYSYTNGLLQSKTEAVGTPLAATWTYGYSPSLSTRTSLTDPDGHTTSYTYDSSGDQTSMTDARGHTMTATFNSLDEPLTVTDAEGVTTTNTYDLDGNLLSSSTPIDGGHTSTTSYVYGDPSNPGLPTAVTDPDGQITHLTYDSGGDLTSVTDPDGNKTVRVYNGIGWMTAMVSPRGEAVGANPTQYTTSYRYDADGRRLSTTDPLGNVTSSTYDGDGNRTTSTDAAGHVTHYGYDQDNELVTETRADGTTLDTGYNADGQQNSQTDGAGHTTTYAYNVLGQRTSSTNPIGKHTSYVYDGAGNLTQSLSPDGHQVDYSYNADNNLIGATYTDGSAPNVTYGYDADGRRTSMTDGTGTSSYSYNEAGWLTSYTNGAGKTVGYVYNDDGDPINIDYPNGMTVTRGYDAADRLTAVTAGNGNPSTGFTYDPDGDVTSETYGNGVVATTSYDPDDQISAITDTAPTLGKLAGFSYTRNNLEQVTSSSDQFLSLPASTSNDTYTRLNQLASDSTGSYSYDSGDNLSAQPGGITQAHNAADELTSQTTTVAGIGVTTTYGYDADGNRTSSQTAGLTSNTLSYNGADELTGENSNGTYAYNGDGLRMSKTTLGQTSQYTYDVTASTPEIIGDGTNYYVYGPGGRAVEQINASTAVITAYLSQDQLGSTRLLTSTAGLVVGAYKYNSYGQPKPISGIVQRITTPIGYAGGYLDSETGFLYLIDRYYDQSTGQFLTRDPLEAATRDPYGYAGEDPLDSVDPSGLDSVAEYCSAVDLPGVELPIPGAVSVKATSCAGATDPYGSVSASVNGDDGSVDVDADLGDGTSVSMTVDALAEKVFGLMADGLASGDGDDEGGVSQAAIDCQGQETVLGGELDSRWEIAAAVEGDTFSISLDVTSTYTINDGPSIELHYVVVTSFTPQSGDPADDEALDQVIEHDAGLDALGDFTTNTLVPEY